MLFIYIPSSKHTHKKTRVPTHLKRYDTHNLHGQKCELQTPFLRGPYPIFCLVNGVLEYCYTTNINL